MIIFLSVVWKAVLTARSWHHQCGGKRRRCTNVLVSFALVPWWQCRVTFVYLFALCTFFLLCPSTGRFLCFTTSTHLVPFLILHFVIYLFFFFVVIVIIIVIVVVIVVIIFTVTIIIVYLYSSITTKALLPRKERTKHVILNIKRVWYVIRAIGGANEL